MSAQNRWMQEGVVTKKLRRWRRTPVEGYHESLHMKTPSALAGELFHI